MLAADITRLVNTVPDLAHWIQAPLQLEKTAELNWPAACVFDLLADHKKWPRLFPWLTGIQVDNTHALIADGLGARRICHFGNGMVLEEVIVSWDPDRSYAYAGIDDSHPFGMTDHVAVVTCEPVGQQTYLSWVHYFHHPNPPAMREQLKETMNAVMESLINNCGGRQIL
ncbi:MAG: SRPBCC family protein [Ardenticatenaceae bacterium]|nr:SRPBCC family protein [Ardenticatenaceae bacterium]